MSYDRIIQDSDDEDDPLSDLEHPTRVIVTNGDAQNNLDMDNAPGPGSGANIVVNFDQFLQSQDTLQAAPSASQQRREERWIPAGRGESIGTMMTEIGLAQQRLLDDDQAHFTNQPAAYFQADVSPIYGQKQNFEIVPPGESGMPLDPNAIPHVQTTAASDDWSQSALSYNIFNSSIQTSSCQLDRADFLPESRATIQTEPILLQTSPPRRWASMQAAPSSPHDTEPFSSVISPKAARAKSDNIALNTVLPSPTSVDELSLPVAIEIPVVEKRGRKKKQSLPDNDDDDELSHPIIQDPSHKKPEKRKPGRPPKHPNVSPEHQDQTNCDIISEYTTKAQAHLPQIIPDENTGKHESKSPTTIVVDERIYSTEVQPKKPVKEPKKKLKRGKTTSVTLTKTYESDVEDDVIWVDERPIVHAAHEEPQPIPHLPKSNDGHTFEPTPAPKKRGRKRKKTSEQLALEAEAAYQQQGPVVIAQEQPLDNYSTSLAVVLDNTKTSTTTTSNQETPNIPDPVNSTTNENNPSTNPLPPQDPTTSPTSPINPTEPEPEPAHPPETPKKCSDPKTPSAKGPSKHSPISSTSKVPYRVGLSKRARIAPLLKIIKR